MGRLFTVNLDLSALADLKLLKPIAESIAKKALQSLAAATYAHLIEQANKKLHTRRQMFIDALSFASDSRGDFVSIVLDESAVWIDEGLNPYNMLEGLLKSDKAKTAKDGSKYLVIPFEHGGGPTQNTPSQMTLLNSVKNALKSKGIPYKKIERNVDGSAKMGLLHSFDISDQPTKTSDGVGQGQGPIGEVMQGWSADKKSGTPLLAGVRVYQGKAKGKKGEDIIKRAVMTFRVASSKHASQEGRWDHPGVEAQDLMKEASEWAVREWENKLSKEFLEALQVSLS